MKKIFACALALFCSLALGATLSPITLLNPAGSTAGQAILSTGPSGAPVWGAVPLTGISGTLAIANGGTGAATAAAARTNLGLGTSATVNTGTSGATVPLLNGSNTWASAQAFSVRPTFNGSTPWDSSNLASPASTASPTFTGVPATTTAALHTSTTQIASTAFVINELSSPPAIGVTTPNTAAFTTVNATGAITPSQTAGIVGTTTNNNANAGSIGEYLSNTTSGTSLTSATPANATSVSLTAGDWDVSCSVQFAPASTTTVSLVAVSVNTTTAALGGQANGLTYINTTFATGPASEYVSSGVVRQSLASTTTVFCPVQSNFATSTMTVNGFIRARRVR